MVDSPREVFAVDRNHQSHQRYSKVAAAAGVVLLVTGLVWLLYWPELRIGRFHYHAIYPVEQMIFSGRYTSRGTLEYKSFGCPIAPGEKVNSSCPLILKYGKSAYYIHELTPEVMRRLGAAEESTDERDLTAFIIKRRDLQPRFVMRGVFQANRIVGYSFEIDDKLDLHAGGDAVRNPCPFTFQIGDKNTLILPIRSDELYQSLGHPSHIVRNIKAP